MVDLLLVFKQELLMNFKSYSLSSEEEEENFIMVTVITLIVGDKNKHIKYV